MKLIICGKGGSGKSTLTSMLAYEYARKNHRVLVVDTDESNSGLHRLIGTDVPNDLLQYFGGKKGIKAKISPAKADNASDQLIDWPLSIDTIPDGFVSKNGQISLVSIGKINHSGEGCACMMGMLSRQFLKSLTLSSGDVVIIDTEAGIEHFGRGIDEEADYILMVVDPSFESIELAKKITSMTTEMKIPMYYVLNRVNPDISSNIRKNLKNTDNIIAEIPEDSRILLMGLSGTPINSEYPQISNLVERINRLEISVQ
jgi:CO dehydrogenase maturation factor